jgi:hypothetical protein
VGLPLARLGFQFWQQFNRKGRALDSRQMSPV